MRLPPATRDNVPEDQRDLFDELARASGGVPAEGPGSILFHVPKLRQLEQAMSLYLRNQTSLPPKIVELAIIVTARAMDCQHIWNSHAGVARKAGVPDALVDALREGRALPPLAQDEAAVVYYGQEFFRTRHVSRGAFQTALEQFGKRGVVELAMLLGQYSALSLVLNSFDADLRSPRTEPLLPA